MTTMGALAMGANEMGASAVADRPAKPKHGGKRQGAGRPPKPGRPDGMVRIDRSFLAKIQIVAKARGLSLSDYLIEVAKSAVDRDLVKIIRSVEDPK
jgi:hypothetical protein